MPVYAAVDSGPPPFSMDPDQGREDVFRQLVYTPAELEKGELDHKTKCKESTKSLERIILLCVWSCTLMGRARIVAILLFFL